MKYRVLLAFIILLPLIYSRPQNLGNGDAINRAKNVHAGNLIRVTFHNNGRLGAISGDQSVAYTGEWPIGSGKVQMGNTSAYVMSEVRVPAGTDSLGNPQFSVITPVIFCEGWDPNVFSHDTLGRFQGFEPLPGFLSLSQKEKDPGNAVAMSHQAFTWPAFWPDKTSDKTNPGWRGSWNGYFGKDQKNADEESFFVMDDYQFNKQFGTLTLPIPIASDPNRGGLGLRMSVRGLQWSNPDAQDCLFWLYDIRNFGELNLPKTLFGCNVGASSGGRLAQSGDWDDDAAKFYREKGLAVNYDLDNVGVGGYTPVPWVGFAFLESPGNPYDGIDNDGDGISLNTPGGGTGKIITIDDFVKFYKVGDAIIIIDYESDDYKRTISTMPESGITIHHNGTTLVRKPNAPLEEIPRNSIDDNLNGLIDENDGAETQDGITYYLYIRSEYNNQDYLSINYFTGEGSTNELIDERRDDGIDNDGDWNVKLDDVGLDGKPGTGDIGEGDGIPTPGTLELPGESNIDQVDVDESDQIGLTSFKFYRYGTLTYSNDEQMWEFSRPGYFDNSTTSRADYDYVFSSGYFPLRPEDKEFFSIAMIYGEDETDILRNKDVVQKIYNSNYNFAVAPNKPKVTAVAGNNQVILTWDQSAESSYDRFLNEYDFEGYKVYKASYHTFGDAGTITDGFGYERFKQPVAIYDRVDNVYGFFPKDFGTGVLFNLGNETGLVHSYVDNDVLNGVKYYYAVTAFDKGNLNKNIAPSETTIFVNVDQNGNIDLSENVVMVTPQAPASGYEKPGFEIEPQMVGSGFTNGEVGVNILAPDSLYDGDEYEIHFLDHSMDKIDNDMNGKIDAADPGELIPTTTTGYVLKNITRGIEQDTVWFKGYETIEDSVISIFNLYDDNDSDPNTLTYVQNGMQFYVYNPEPSLIHKPEKGIFNGIQWGNNLVYDSSYIIMFDKFNLSGFYPGTPYPRQYQIVFFDDSVGMSAKMNLYLTKGTKYPVASTKVNFKIFDKQSGNEVEFGFVDQTVKSAVPVHKGTFSAKDRIFLYEKLANDSLLVTYILSNLDDEDSTFYKRNGRYLGTGDTLNLYPGIPFNSNTYYRFKVKGQKINNETAKYSMENIRVVPNPYVVTALWEPHNPYTSGRGPRELQFINLPERCTIRIYTVDGTLVRTLEHDKPISNGSESWDLMTKDNMDLAYGIYVYHVDAPGVGEHVGRIMIIK